MPPKVSVIIPTYNNQDTIAVCLESIMQQTYENVEVIVADGHSTDLTRSVCEKYDIEVYDADLGRAAARLEASKRADGQYLFHIDSDMQLAEELISECVDLIESSDALMIPEINVGDSYWAECTDIGKSISRKQKVGNLRFLSKNLYFEVGGHNPELLSKEDEELHDLVVDKNPNIRFTENVIYHHIGNMGIFDILHKRYRYIQSLTRYEAYSRTSGDENSITPSQPLFHILLEEAQTRPKHMLGYLFLDFCTALLSAQYRCQKKLKMTYK